MRHARRSARRRPRRQPKKAPAKEADAEHAEEGEDAAKKPPKKKRQDPVEAQRAIDAALKLLEAGKSDQAAQALTTVLGGGNLPPAIMAKALLYRGIAYRQQRKPAQAIADLTSALWLKGGLTAEDRQDALKQRSGAYADAGLTESGEAATATAVAAATAPATKEAKERPASKSWGVVTTPADNAPANTTQTAEGGGNWFKNWFSNSSPAQAKAATVDCIHRQGGSAAANPTTGCHTARRQRLVKQRPRFNPRRTAAETRAPTVRPAAATAEGSFACSSPPCGRSRKRPPWPPRPSALLRCSRRTRTGNRPNGAGQDGLFYRVLVGPFATVQETQAVCAKAKGTGFDCLTVTQ